MTSNNPQVAALSPPPVALQGEKLVKLLRLDTQEILWVSVEKPEMWLTVLHAYMTTLYQYI